MMAEDHHNLDPKMDRYASGASFSATLLDAICSSIGEGEGEDELVVYGETMMREQRSTVDFENQEEIANFGRLQTIEEWMEREGEKIVLQRRYLADFEPKARSIDNPEVVHYDLRWGCSDLSTRGAFVASSETEELVFADPTKKSSSFSRYGSQKPTHQRATLPVKRLPHMQDKRESDSMKQKPNHEGGSAKTKSRGGKLASFLNSLISACHNEKAKHTEERGRKSRFLRALICSSTPSASKSCNSRTHFSSEKQFSDGANRSIRLYPVTVILDEVCQPSGKKHLHEEKPRLVGVKDTGTTIDEELKNYNLEKNLQIGEDAKDLLRNHQKGAELEFDLRSSNHDKNHVLINVDEDFDTSSDLFELNYLSVIGMER